MTGHSRLTHKLTTFFHKLSETARVQRVAKKPRIILVFGKKMRKTKKAATDMVLDTVLSEEQRSSEQEAAADMVLDTVLLEEQQPGEQMVQEAATDIVLDTVLEEQQPSEQEAAADMVLDTVILEEQQPSEQNATADMVLDTVSEEEEEPPNELQRDWLSLRKRVRGMLFPPLSEKLADIVLKATLGMGSYGTAYLTEKPDGSRSALKVVKKSRLARKRGGAGDMMNEKDILKLMKLASRELDMFVILKDSYQDAHNFYFDTVYCPGGSLADVLEDCGGVISERRTQFIAAQLVVAISYMHSKGIIHRDLKPDNCLISENGYVRIADFGLAVDLAREDKPDATCGTPGYMAPEVYKREQYSEPADLWSLGCMVYQMLVGKPPFDDDDVGLIEVKTREKLVTFHEAPNVSLEAQHLVRSLLLKSQNRRMKVSEILQHPFFGKRSYIKGDWDSVRNQTLKPQPHWIPEKVATPSNTALSKEVLLDHGLRFCNWSPSAAERAFEMTTESWEMVEQDRPQASRRLPGASGQNLATFDLSVLPTGQDEVEDDGADTTSFEGTRSQDEAVPPVESWKGLFNGSIHLVDKLNPIVLPKIRIPPRVPAVVLPKIRIPPRVPAATAQNAIVNQWNPAPLITPTREVRFELRNESPAGSEFTFLNPSAYPSSAAITLVPSLPGSSRNVLQQMAPVSKGLRRMKAFGDRSGSKEQTASSSPHC